MGWVLLCYCDLAIAANARKSNQYSRLKQAKSQAVEYINYAKSVNPKLFRLLLGQN